MTKNLVIAALVGIIAVGGVLSAIATSQTVETNADVEVRVWQSVSSGALYLSTRPADGTWTTHDDEALDMSELSRSGNYRQSNYVTVAVPIEVVVPVAQAEQPTYNPDGTLNPNLERANIWIVLWSGTEASAKTSWSMASNTLEVSVKAGERHGILCNPEPLLNGVEGRLGCEGLSGVAHADVDAVSAVYAKNNPWLGWRYQCVRHSQSTAEVSIWACVGVVE